MKIAVITNAFGTAGGVGTYVFTVATELKKTGHGIAVIHSDRSVKNSADTHYVEKFDAFEAPDAAEKAAQVMRILENEKPDMVHVMASTNFLMEEKIRARFPAVKTLHVYDFCPTGNKYHHAVQHACHHRPGAICVPMMIFKRCTLSMRPETMSLFYRRAAASTANDAGYKKIIVASEHMRREAIHSGYSDDQVETLPYCTRYPELKNSSLHHPPVILFSGRMVPEKGIDRLLRAAAGIDSRLPWELHLAGDGPERKKLEGLARKCGIAARSRFLGWLSSDQMAEQYQNASFLVFPSMWPEPFGLAGIEAMSYGVPVIGFAAGGVPEWLENNRTGYLVESGDVPGLRAAMERLLREPVRAKEMGENGRNTVKQKFSADAHITRLLEIYTGVINSFKNGPHEKGE